MDPRVKPEDDKNHEVYNIMFLKREMGTGVCKVFLLGGIGTNVIY
jgi:hypothetical protein